MTRGRGSAEKAAHAERAAAVRACRRCDPCGWLLGPDRTPIDPAVRCDHRAPATPPAVRDITEPIHHPEDEQ